MIGLLSVVHVMTLKSEIALTVVNDVGMFDRNRRMTTECNLCNGWLNVIGNDVLSQPCFICVTKRLNIYT